jgi:hypothetical protein
VIFAAWFETGAVAFNIGNAAALVVWVKICAVVSAVWFRTSVVEFTTGKAGAFAVWFNIGDVELSIGKVMTFVVEFEIIFRVEGARVDIVEFIIGIEVVLVVEFKGMFRDEVKVGIFATTLLVEFSLVVECEVTALIGACVFTMCATILVVELDDDTD